MLKLAAEIADYDATVGKTRARMQAGHGKQQGDAAKGARAIIATVSAEHPPVHLLIGGDAPDQLCGKFDDLRRETDAWESVTQEADFEAEAQPS